MRLFELRKTKEELAAIKREKELAAIDLWKSPRAVHDRAVEDLEQLKEQGTKLRVLDNLQLFVPRGSKTLWTKKERYNSLLSTGSAWDDEGQLVPHYQRWVDQATESKKFNVNLLEGAPILVDSPVTSGGTKPDGAVLWTSSAVQKANGSYSSGWSRLIADSYSSSDWYSPKGYLYKIKPGTCLLDLDNDQYAVRVYNIFADLNRGNNSLIDPERFKNNSYMRDEDTISRDFPWLEVSKHFDGVYHSGFGYDSKFIRGWECESIAWFKSDRLELLGQCNVSKKGNARPWDDVEDDE